MSNSSIFLDSYHIFQAVIFKMSDRIVCFVTPVGDDNRVVFELIRHKDKSRMLPRPISICDVDSDTKTMRIVFRIAGAGTEEFSQLENGVGMMRLLINEYNEAFESVLKTHKAHIDHLKRTISIATGRLVYSSIKELAEKAEKVCPGLKVNVYEIINEFFGEKITVSGLLTGQDIIKQLKGKDLGEMLYLPVRTESTYHFCTRRLTSPVETS